MEKDDKGAARGFEEQLGHDPEQSSGKRSEGEERGPGQCGEEEKSPRYETAAEDSDSREKESSAEGAAAAKARAEQRRRAKVASKQARQRAALRKHLARCGGPGSANSTPRSASLRKTSPGKRSAAAIRSTNVRLEIDRGDQPPQQQRITRHPRSISLRLDDLKGKGRTTLSRSPKRSKSHGDIEVIRIEAPEESTGPSYSSVVFPLPYTGSSSLSEIIPQGNLPPEPKPGRPVTCPPTERDARSSTSRSKGRDKKKHKRGVPSFVPREVIAEKNAWKSGLCDCWRDSESYWSGVMEQVV